MNKTKMVIIVMLSLGLLSSAVNAETITVTGADAMVPLLTKLGAEFSKVNPSVKIDVTGGGAGKGLKEALAGRVNLGMVSRTIEADEAERGSFVPVAKDAVFATVNATNPASSKLAEKGLSKKVMKALWLAGKETSWGEITGSDTKDKVKIYTREDSCGAAEIWAKYLGSTQNDLQGTPVKGDNGLADAIRKDPLGLGYNNMQAAFNLSSGTAASGLMVVAIDVNENGKIDPEEDIATKEKAIKAISAGIYPSPPARTLHLITKGKFSGISKDFVRWILKDGQKLVSEIGYIPLNPTVADDSIKKME